MNPVDAAAGITAIDWGTVFTYTLVGLLSSAILAVVGWLLKRWKNARDADREAKKEAKAAEQAAAIAKIVTENFATVTQNFQTLDARLTSRIDDSDTRTAEQFTEVKAAATQAAEKISKLEVTQFGANGGGLREAVNKLTEKADQMTTDVAYLKGSFEQFKADTTQPPKP